MCRILHQELRFQNSSEVNEQTTRNDTNQNKNVREDRRNEQRKEQCRPQNAGQTNGNSHAVVKPTGNRPANNSSATNIDKGSEDGWHTVNKRKNKNNANNNHVVMTTQKGNDTNTANMINDGQSTVIVTHNNSEGEVNMEVMPVAASLIPQAQVKHTIRDIYNTNKDNKKSKLLTINKAGKKIYQGKEADYPEIELSSELSNDFVNNQKDIMNTSLVNIKLEETKKMNKKGRKFKEKMYIPGDVVLTSDMDQENHGLVYRPLFGLDPKLAEKYAS
ncbi:uncharacterized protein [Nicotiana tomentosiformis]|uniref:uncharacterized protein n=1 Tax=Nicotiana tomentosiformis TaxID=4098 RepID=UPI00388CD1CC